MLVRCIREPGKHAKLLKFNSEKFSREMVELIAAVFDGTSPHFTYKPGPGSPIGKCVLCGAALETEIQEIDSHAKHE